MSICWSFNHWPLYSPLLSRVRVSLCATTETPNAEEEEYEGEGTPGDDQGQTEPIGKPPFYLAYLNPIIAAYALIFELALFSQYRSCLWHSDTPPSLPPLRVLPLV